MIDKTRLTEDFYIGQLHLDGRIKMLDEPKCGNDHKVVRDKETGFTWCPVCGEQL